MTELNPQLHHLVTRVMNLVKGRINSYPPPTVKRPERNVMMHTLVIATVDRWSLDNPVADEGESGAGGIER